MPVFDVSSRDIFYGTSVKLNKNLAWEFGLLMFQLCTIIFFKDARRKFNHKHVHSHSSNSINRIFWANRQPPKEGGTSIIVPGHIKNEKKKTKLHFRAAPLNWITIWGTLAENAPHLPSQTERRLMKCKMMSFFCKQEKQHITTARRWQLPWRKRFWSTAVFIDRAKHPVYSLHKPSRRNMQYSFHISHLWRKFLYIMQASTQD